LKEGEFKEDYMVNQSTMEFQPNKDEMVGSSLSSAIFPILRREHTRTSIGEFTIGRTDENDLVMNDFSISKKHAIITSTQDALLVKDLDSRNGVTVDGDFIHPSQPETIKAGTELGIGRYQFEVVDPEVLYQRVKSNL
jgi:pSer/pThr/pTyr-binding forkhead associated (FHA) protein